MDGVILDPRERCEKEEEFNSWEVLGLTAAIIGMVQWIPEMITVFTSTSLEAANPWLFLLGGVSNVMWTVYGFAVNSISIILSSVFVVVLTLIILITLYVRLQWMSTSSTL